MCCNRALSPSGFLIDKYLIFFNKRLYIWGEAFFGMSFFLNLIAITKIGFGVEILKFSPTTYCHRQDKVTATVN